MTEDKKRYINYVTGEKFSDDRTTGRELAVLLKRSAHDLDKAIRSIEGVAEALDGARDRLVVFHADTDELLGEYEE